MNFIDLILENQTPSNKIVNTILINSGLENRPDKEDLVQKINNLFPRFQQVRNGLSLDSPQVKTFLQHFDGTHGEKFKGNLDAGDIKNPAAYTLPQLEFLIDEYKTDPQEQQQIDSELLTKTQYNDETAEISKKLWYDPTTAIINLPGFRVYHPKNQQDSIKFGWYEQKLQNEIRPGWHSWCVTWRTGNNRWASYRSSGGTFYFIIDESKENSDDTEVKKYYLGALQVFNTNKSYHPTGYELTDITNPGEVKKSWEELLKIYPQLAEYKDLLQPVEFSEDEVENQSVVGRMNEREGDKYNFSRMSRKYKQEYIDSYQKITKAESWYHMDKKLREKYITLTSSAGDFRHRFPSFDLLRAVKKTNDFKLLNSEMVRKGISDGVKSLTMNLMQDLRPKEERRGIVNDSIILIRTQDKRYGLFDENDMNWVVRNGDEYSPSYLQISSNVVENKSTKEKFYIDEFASYDGDSFVAITPLVDIDSYFLSKNAWNKIKDKFTENPDENMADNAQDINEE